MSEGNNAARRTEDIALDLLKFIAATTHVGTKAASSSVGFGVAASGKPDDQVADRVARGVRIDGAVRDRRTPPPVRRRAS